MERVAIDEVEGSVDFDGKVFFDGVLFLETSDFDPFATPDVKCPMSVSTLDEADLLDAPPPLPCLELT